MLFIATGGTIDKLPAYLPDGSFDNDSRLFDKTHLPEMIEKVRFLGEHTILSLFMLDSLDMTDGHRELLGVVIDGTQHEQIIVTHGTDTMAETARALSIRHYLATKTVVLTGAMIPFSMGEASDAVPNLASAIAHTQTLSPGVYISMHDEVFTTDNVWKDKDAGVFRTLS